MRELVARNSKIVEMIKSGTTYREIANRFDISEQRVEQIASKNGVSRIGSGRSRKHDLDEIFKFIVDFKRVNDGISPTLKEIGDSCNISSKCVVSNSLRRLERQGKIELIGHKKSRMIKVIGGRWLFQNN